MIALSVIFGYFVVLGVLASARTFYEAYNPDGYASLLRAVDTQRSEVGIAMAFWPVLPIVALLGAAGASFKAVTSGYVAWLKAAGKRRAAKLPRAKVVKRKRWTSAGDTGTGK